MVEFLFGTLKSIKNVVQTLFQNLLQHYTFGDGIYVDLRKGMILADFKRYLKGYSTPQNDFPKKDTS